MEKKWKMKENEILKNEWKKEKEINIKKGRKREWVRPWLARPPAQLGSRASPSTRVTSPDDQNLVSQRPQQRQWRWRWRRRPPPPKFGTRLAIQCPAGRRARHRPAARVPTDPPSPRWNPVGPNRADWKQPIRARIFITTPPRRYVSQHHKWIEKAADNNGGCIQREEMPLPRPESDPHPNLTPIKFVMRLIETWRHQQQHQRTTDVIRFEIRGNWEHSMAMRRVTQIGSKPQTLSRASIFVSLSFFFIYLYFLVFFWKRLRRMHSGASAPSASDRNNQS